MDRALKYFIGKRFAFSPDYRHGDLIGLIDTSLSENDSASRRACPVGIFTRDGKRAAR
jgi:hypothetical protein